MKNIFSRASYIPSVAVKVQSKKSSAVAYLYERAGAAYAIGFSGRGDKPAVNYRFKDAVRRADYIASWMRSVDEAEERKAAAVAARRDALSQKQWFLKVGDVLRSSWGYDQTNIDYYQVVELFGKRGVVIREIACESIETMSMQGQSVPAIGQFIGEPMRKQVGESGCVKVRNWGVLASKMEPVKVDGIAVGYNSSSWTAYA